MVTNIKHITLVECLDTFQRTYVKYLNRVYIFNFRNQQKMKMSDAYGSTFSGATYHRASDESQITREPIGFCRIFTREKMGSRQFLLQQFYFFNCLRRQRRALKVSIYFERGGGISGHQGDFLNSGKRSCIIHKLVVGDYFSTFTREGYTYTVVQNFQRFTYLSVAKRIQSGIL